LSKTTSSDASTAFSKKNERPHNTGFRHHEFSNTRPLNGSKPPNDENMYRSLSIPSNDFQVDTSETNLSKTTSSDASTAFSKKNETGHNTGFRHHEFSNTRPLNGSIIQNPNVGKEFRGFRGMTSNHSEVDTVTGETKRVTTTPKVTAESQYQFSKSKKASNGKQNKFDHKHWTTIKPRQHTNVEEPGTVSGNPQEDITSVPEVKVGNSTQVYIGDEFERAALKIHNDLRKRHQAPPLILDKALHALAQEWAQELMKRKTKGGGNINMTDEANHRPNNIYGENLGYSHSPDAKPPAKLGPEEMVQAAIAAVTSWYGEKKYYDFSKPVPQKGSGHFTQVIWKGSTKLGMALVYHEGDAYIVANYGPAGNVEGEYKENVLPEQI